MKRTTLFVMLMMILSSISIGQESLLNSKSKHFTKTAATPLVEQSARKVYPGLLNKTTKSTMFFEGFETSPNPSGGALPEGWTQKRTSTLDETPISDPDPASGNWFRHEPGVYGFATGNYVYSGNASMAIGYTSPQFTWAISPEFTITGDEGEPVFLSYYKWYTNDGSSGVFPTSYHVTHIAAQTQNKAKNDLVFS